MQEASEGSIWLQDRETVRGRSSRTDQIGPDRCVYLYMCRLSGPSRLDEDGPEEAESEGGAPSLKGLESKAETAMDARVLAPGNTHVYISVLLQSLLCIIV